MSSVVKTSWKEFTYEKVSGKPTLRYDPILQANRHKIGRTHVSVSHDGDYVYSSVLIEGILCLFVRISFSMKSVRTYFAINNYIRIKFTASREGDASTLTGILILKPFLSSYHFARPVTCEHSLSESVAVDNQPDSMENLYSNTHVHVSQKPAFN